MSCRERVAQGAETPPVLRRRRSHAELDEAPDLDAGDPLDLGARYAGLRRRWPQFTVLGG
jgi:hypothetical protein